MPERTTDKGNMPERTTANQSGGVNFFGGKPDIKGDVVGGDQTKTINFAPPPELDNALRPVAEAIRSAPSEKQAEAEAKLDELKREAAKGEDADDGVVARLVDGLVSLVPGAVSAVVAAFGSPILSGVAGSATKFVLDKIQG
jgi:hypothetical protein